MVSTDYSFPIDFIDKINFASVQFAAWLFFLGHNHDSLILQWIFNRPPFICK